MDKITYIPREQINSQKWDACISQSANPLANAYSSYLDAICENQWGALVYGDYEAVFPLPWKKKFGIHYIYQPFFCQQLGLFAPAEFPLDQYIFLQSIPTFYKKIHLHLNPHFSISLELPKRTNYLLSLLHPYHYTQQNYSKDAHKNLRKIEGTNILYTQDISIDEVIEIYRSSWGALNPRITKTHYTNFAKACKQLEKEDRIFKIKAIKNNRVLGAAIFLKSSKYLHYVCAAPLEEGKKIGIMHGIIDEVIRHYSGGQMTLDFEGSEIPGVAAFYEKFNPENHGYYVFQKNNLPIFLRWLKK
jgi:hypothetical protein